MLWLLGSQGKVWTTFLPATLSTGATGQLSTQQGRSSLVHACRHAQGPMGDPTIHWCWVDLTITSMRCSLCNVDYVEVCCAQEVVCCWFPLWAPHSERRSWRSAVDSPVICLSCHPAYDRLAGTPANCVRFLLKRRLVSTSLVVQFPATIGH